MLSVDLAVSISVNLLLLLQPSGACKKGEVCDFLKSIEDDFLNSQLFGGQYLKQCIDCGMEGASDLHFGTSLGIMLALFTCSPESCCAYLGAHVRCATGAFPVMHISPATLTLRFNVHHSAVLRTDCIAGKKRSLLLLLLPRRKGKGTC